MVYIMKFVQFKDTIFFKILMIITGILVAVVYLKIFYNYSNQSLVKISGIFSIIMLTSVFLSRKKQSRK